MGNFCDLIVSYGKQDKASHQGFFVFTYVKEVDSVIIYELIIHTETKKIYKKSYFPNCPLGNWKKPLFHFVISKKLGLSQKVLIKIRSFASESARTFNEISNSFLVIWHDKIKLFSSNNWWRSIKHRSISSTLFKKKTWSRVFLLSVLLFDSAFVSLRIWIQQFCYQLIISDNFYSCDLTSCI